MSGQHASLPPSAAPIWGNCSGYLSAIIGQPDSESEASRAGTASHWVVSESLEHGGEPSEFLGLTDPDGTVVDDGMVEGAQVMVDMVRGLQPLYPLALVEQRVYMPQIHENNWGTLDSCQASEDLRKFVLSDYKHGHAPVSPVRSLQLADYALGVLNHYGISLQDPATLDIAFEFRICQPFAYSPEGPIKIWYTTVRELMPLWHQLHVQAHSDPHMTVGKHCRYCPAVGKCEAARNAMYSVIEYCQEPYVIDSMTGAELATEREILAAGAIILQARRDAIEDDLMHRLKAGASDTGLAIKGTVGRAAWTMPEPQVIAIMKSVGLDVSKPAALTPTQVKKLAKTEHQVAALEAINGRPGGKLVIVSADDKPSAKAFRPKGK